MESPTNGEKNVEERVHPACAGAENGSCSGIRKITTGTRPADKKVGIEPQVLPYSQPCCEVHQSGGASKTGCACNQPTASGARSTFGPRPKTKGVSGITRKPGSEAKRAKAFVCHTAAEISSSPATMRKPCGCSERPALSNPTWGTWSAPKVARSNKKTSLDPNPEGFKTVSAWN